MTPYILIGYSILNIIFKYNIAMSFHHHAIVTSLSFSATQTQKTAHISVIRITVFQSLLPYVAYDLWLKLDDAEKPKCYSDQGKLIECSQRDDPLNTLRK